MTSPWSTKYVHFIDSIRTFKEKIPSVKISEIKTHSFQMDVSWATETLIANPMSIYPKFKEKRSSWYGRQWATVVEIKSDGISGYGFIGGASRGSVAAIEDQFKIFLEGADPFNTELIWEQCFRASQYYGRKGAALNAISGIDIALWDLKGKILGRPVYDLIGGKTKDRLRAYATGIFTQRNKELGFRDVKIPVRHGPGDGKEGLKKNEEDIKKTREVLGPDGDLMLDAAQVGIGLGRQSSAEDGDPSEKIGLQRAHLQRKLRAG